MDWARPLQLWNDDEIKNYIDELAELGYVWQFITLAGFHVNGLSIELLPMLTGSSKSSCRMSERTTG